MNGDGVSLRSLVDKWLAPTASVPARVTRLGRLVTTRSRYVQLEVSTTRGVLAIVFFRHDHDSWDVFPPAAASPAMCARIVRG